MTTRTAMIEQAVLAAGKFGCHYVTLESIAAGASVPLDAARAEFVNTAGLIRAVDDVLNDECSAELDAASLVLPNGATVKEKFSALGRGFLGFASCNLRPLRRMQPFAFDHHRSFGGQPRFTVFFALIGDWALMRRRVPGTVGSS